MITQVRGSSCSGKTTAVTSILHRYPPVGELWEPGWTKRNYKLAGYLLPGDLFIAGGYLPTTRTGGLDAFGSGNTSKIWAWLRWHCARHRHVLFEGLMASLVIGRSVEFYEQMNEARVPGLPVTYAFLDTPLEVVLERLQTRTGGLGPTGKGVKLDATGEVSWKRIQKIRANFESRGIPVSNIRWQSCREDLEALVYAGGWNPNGPAGVTPMPPPRWWYEKIAEETGDDEVILSKEERKARRADAKANRIARKISTPAPSSGPTLDDRLDAIMGG